MISYQKTARSYQTEACSREAFWECIRNISTEWKINARRDIMDVVARHDEAGISRWEDQVDYKKYLLGMQTRQKGALWPAFSKKSREERLLAYAGELKSELPAFIFSCRAFDESINKKGKVCHSRKLTGCHLNGLVMLDIDHVENPMAIYEKLKADKALMARTALVHITSSQKGLRIVFTACKSVGNLADNQLAFAEQLGYEPDRSCIDATRVSFAPMASDILYINEGLLFDYYDEEFDREYTPMYREKKTQPVKLQSSVQNAACSVQNALKTDSALSPQPSAQETPSVLAWHGYDIQQIINARYADKLPCREDSNRHTESLKLATDLLLMLDRDKELVLSIVKSQSWVKEIIDERNEDVSQTVESAAESVIQREKHYGSTLPSKVMQEAIQRATGLSYKDIVEHKSSESIVISGNDVNRYLWIWGERIEAMMPEYPILRDICKGLKRNQYPAALFVAGGLMMTLMTRCTYRFYHRPEELRRLNCSELIIGDPASGKSFATRLYELLAAPIVKADEAGIDAINAHRSLTQTKSANKDKPKKPVVVIRDHPARTSNKQFIEDMVNAKEMVDGVMMQLHMLTFDTELDNTLSLQKGGSWINKNAMQLKAFHNEQDGQAYGNQDSVYQKFKVYWNFIYTGTPLALRQMVTPQNFGSGQAIRLTCIPLPSTKFKMLDRESTIDYSSGQRLTEWAEKLDRMKGELPMGKIVDKLFDWTTRRMADAEDNNSEADEMLVKRCAYHGVNFSAPFIVMRHWDAMQKDGDYWCGEFETDEVDWQLAELITNIQYACQRHYFGAMAEAYFDNQQKESVSRTQHQSKTAAAYNRLPEVFTIPDVERCFNLNGETSARKRIERLENDHLVAKISDSRERGCEVTKYRKTGTMFF